MAAPQRILKLGEVVGQLECIKVGERHYTFMCNCSNIVVKPIYTSKAFPSMCKDCARTLQSSSIRFGPGAKIEVREYSSSEEAMIAEFLSSNS